VIITSASRATNRVYASRASNSRGYIGLKYERAAIAMLKSIIPQSMSLEANPWFYYKGLDASGSVSGACSTDALIFDNEFDFIIVVEIKNTYIPVAIDKLNSLYCPVVAKVFGKPTKPLVLVRNLIPGSPVPKLSISSALLADIPLVQWIGTGKIRL
jgi:hypothetical protein